MYLRPYIAFKNRESLTIKKKNNSLINIHVVLIEL